MKTKPGYYVVCPGMTWTVVKWDGKKASKGRKIGPVGAERTSYFDKACAFAQSKNEAAGFDIWMGDIYQPSLAR